MGGIIKASCECGFATDFMAGSGKDNFEEVCQAPAVCLNCSKLIVENYFSKEAACPSCREKVTFYDDPSLQEIEEEDTESPSSAKTTIFILPDVKCLCPQCDTKRLTFTHVGCWS